MAKTETHRSNLVLPREPRLRRVCCLDGCRTSECAYLRDGRGRGLQKSRQSTTGHLPWLVRGGESGSDAVRWQGGWWAARARGAARLPCWLHLNHVKIEGVLMVLPGSHNIGKHIFIWGNNKIALCSRREGNFLLLFTAPLSPLRNGRKGWGRNEQSATDCQPWAG